MSSKWPGPFVTLLTIRAPYETGLREARTSCLRILSIHSNDLNQHQHCHMKYFKCTSVILIKKMSRKACSWPLYFQKYLLHTPTIEHTICVICAFNHLHRSSSLKPAVEGHSSQGHAASKEDHLTTAHKVIHRWKIRAFVTVWGLHGCKASMRRERCYQESTDSFLILKNEYYCLFCPEITDL